MNLWGNKLDLSISLGKVDANSSKYLFDINRLDEDLLADDSERVWDTISTSSGSGIIGNNFFSNLIAHNFYFKDNFMY